MGTNYYHESQPVNPHHCGCCGRALLCETCDAPVLHIGKSSAGWTFSFQGYDDPAIRSYRDWLARLEAGGVIRDEYGQVVLLDDFKALVKQKRTERNHHARQYPSGREFTDPDGHSFSMGEFS